ncbi:MAG: hypothetical protein K8S87_08670 [Planctomycetes bacterium]|nr:hypothetical protein [Planctomycetota bacterium]
MKICRVCMFLFFAFLLFSLSSIIAQEKEEKGRKYDFSIWYETGKAYYKTDNVGWDIDFKLNDKVVKNQIEKRNTIVKVSMFSLHSKTKPKDVRVDYIKDEGKAPSLKGCWVLGSFDLLNKFTVSKYSEKFPEIRKSMFEDFTLRTKVLPTKKLAVGETYSDFDFKNMFELKNTEDKSINGSGSIKFDSIITVNTDRIAVLKADIKFKQVVEKSNLTMNIHLKGVLHFNLDKHLPVKIILEGDISGTITGEKGEITLEGKISGTTLFATDSDIESSKSKKYYEFKRKFDADTTQILSETMTSELKFYWNGKFQKEQTEDTSNIRKIEVLETWDTGKPKKIKVTLVKMANQNLKGCWFEAEYTKLGTFKTTKYSEDFPGFEKLKAKSYAFNSLDFLSGKLAVGDTITTDNIHNLFYFGPAISGSGTLKFDSIIKTKTQEIALFKITLNLKGRISTWDNATVKASGNYYFSITNQQPISLNLAGLISGSRKIGKNIQKVDGKIKITSTISVSVN